MKQHADESKWLQYSMSIFKGRLGGRREDYQLEALLAVRKALHAVPKGQPQKPFVAQASKWAALNVFHARRRRERLEGRYMELDHRRHEQGPTETGRVRGILAHEDPAIIRYLVGDMTDKIAAECLGISPSGLRSRVNRLRDKHRV